jgi:hypothetical protein
MIDECLREAEVVEAVANGAWPSACSADLKAHVASCAICSELAAVAGAIRGDCESARAHLQVPSAGLVWWRAQLRARQHNAEAAGRPISYVQAAAAVLAAGLLFMLGGLVWPSLRESVAWIDLISQVADTGRFWLPLALVVGAWLVLAPVVLLFALSDD